MSYILDALRKSEQERQAAAQPADIPQWQQQQVSAGNSRWVMPLMVMLALLIVAALIANIVTPVGGRVEQTDATDNLPLVAETADQQSAGKALVAAEPLYAPASVAGEVSDQAGMAISSSVSPVQLPSTPPPVVVSNTRFIDHKPQESLASSQKNEQQQNELQPEDAGQGTPANINESKAEETRTMPPLDTLRRIPQLMINSHIYSPVAEKRSVIINNREWHEGDSLAAGVQLKEITPDGILLDADGWPVHVGRSKGWQAIP